MIDGEANINSSRQNTNGGIYTSVDRVRWAAEHMRKSRIRAEDAHRKFIAAKRDLALSIIAYEEAERALG